MKTVSGERSGVQLKFERLGMEVERRD
jgi:hypothetical protein